MREPIQVLIIPYIFVDSHIRVLIFKRTTGKYWQFISGGKEQDETLEDTVKREIFEEIGVKISNFISLQTRTMIPANVFDSIFKWDTVFVIEYTFAINLEETQEIVLSAEHDEYKLVSYAEAMELLKWDSNKTALYELFKKIA